MAERTNYTHEEFMRDLQDGITTSLSGDTKLFFGEGGRMKSLLDAITNKLEELQLQVNITNASNRIQTAFGAHKDVRAFDFNFSRKTSSKGLGIQVFVGEDDRTDDLLIPSGFVVQTEADFNNLRKQYITTSDITLPSGSTSITGYIMAVNYGTVGNVFQSGVITDIAESLAGLASTYNYDAITNGTEYESDEQFNLRFKNYILSLQAGNEQAVKSAVYSVGNINYVDIKPNSPTVGNVAIYISNESGVIDSITRSLIDFAIKKAIGTAINYTLITPTVSSITISADVNFYGENFNESNLNEIIVRRLKDFINSRKKNKLYISDLIYEIRRENYYISNVSNVKINGSTSDLILNDVYAIKILNDSDITLNLIRVD